MWLRKEQGGCEITHQRVTYAWEEDGAVTEVPYELGLELTAIRGGGFTVAQPPEPEGDGEEGGEAEGGQGEENGEGEGQEDGPEGDGGEAGGPAEPPAKSPRTRSRKPAS